MDLALVPRGAIPLRAYFWLTIVGPSLLPVKSETKEGLLSYIHKEFFWGYNPERAITHQGAIMIIREAGNQMLWLLRPCLWWFQGLNLGKFRKDLLAWQSKSRHEIPWRCLILEKNLGIMHAFVTSKNKSTIEVAPQHLLGRKTTS